MSNWKDKRINAINRLIKRNLIPDWYVLDEYCNVINSKANNKKQYKQQKASK